MTIEVCIFLIVCLLLIISIYGENRGGEKRSNVIVLNKPKTLRPSPPKGQNSKLKKGIKNG